MKKNDIRRLVIASLLIGLNIVLSRLVSISNANFKISLSFITLVIAAYLYGPFYSCLVGGASDLIGSLLFPIGVYNPLFTLTAILSGLIYGLFLYKELKIKNIILSVFIDKLIISLLINTLVISILYKTSFKALFLTRLHTNIIMIIIEMAIIVSLKNFLMRLKKNNG